MRVGTSSGATYDEPAADGRQWRDRIKGMLWIGFVLALVAVAMIPVDRAAQAIFVLVAMPFLLVMRRLSRPYGDNLPRAFVLFLACFMTLRYLGWRLFFTLDSADPISEIAALALFCAELYTAFLLLTGVFVNFFPVRRTERMLDMTAPVPSVDVLVPTYNEPVELLDITLRACKMIRYPEGRMRLHLLDDGGTAQRCADPDPVAALAARGRQAEMQALCARLGVRYLTRERNEKAKAGNINAALKKTDGDLVLILDADHVPTVDILERTVGYFQDNAKVFLVQTPHFMINPDPIDRNLLHEFDTMPVENEMFYTGIQKGLDYWNSSFFCGSAAVLRRAHLALNEGLSTLSITEDCETSLDLHAHGLKSVYVSHPLVAGLQPQSFSSFVTQRLRWAQGMTQILLLKNPLRRKGLAWYQRICYLRNGMFWLFPFARLIFVLSPLLYLFFGLQIYNATFSEILIYTLPYILSSLTVADMLFGRTRWPLVSEIYEIMQSVYSIPALARIFVNPRAARFVVTPKREVLTRDFVSPLAAPFHAMLLITIVAFGFGAWRVEAYPETAALTWVVIFWNTLNCVFLLAAFAALMERRQRRAMPRVSSGFDGHVLLGNGRRILCRVADLSESGASLALDHDDSFAIDDIRMLGAFLAPMKRDCQLNISVRSTVRRETKTTIGVQFHPASEQEHNDIVALMYADSRKWQALIEQRTQRISFFRAFSIVFALIWRALIERRSFDGTKFFGFFTLWRRFFQRQSASPTFID